jgi:hypothetical protein
LSNTKKLCKVKPRAADEVMVISESDCHLKPTTRCKSYKALSKKQLWILYCLKTPERKAFLCSLRFQACYQSHGIIYVKRSDRPRGSSVIVTAFAKAHADSLSSRNNIFSADNANVTIMVKEDIFGQK